MRATTLVGMDSQRVPIATRQQLALRGIGRTQLDRGLREGRFVRIRPGYYAAPDAPAELVAAVRAGGIATGVTALRHYGVWVPSDARLHVAVAPSAHPPPPRPDVVRHWASGSAHRAGASFSPVAPLVLALGHAIVDARPEHAVAMLDSALHRRLVQADAVQALLASAPRRVRRAIGGRLDARAESGLESIVRFLLGCGGITCEVQVVIAGIGRVDLLVDGWLIIEVDGAQHADVAQMRKDRVRDAVAVRLGMRTLRFGADLVLGDPDTLLATVRAALAQGRPAAADW